jgi:hypothetical protein
MRIRFTCFSAQFDAVLLNFMDWGSQFVQVDTEANAVQFSKKSSERNVPILSDGFHPTGFGYSITLTGVHFSSLCNK